MKKTISLNPMTLLPMMSAILHQMAAYACVSTDSEERLTSYGAQADYCTKYIRSRSDWEFVDVYTDACISAASACPGLQVARLTKSVRLF